MLEKNPPELRTEFLAKFEIRADSIHDLGATQFGTRRFFIVKGGQFEGPQFSGVVVGGCDPLLQCQDGTEQIFVNLLLRTHDGVNVHMRYGGIKVCTPEVQERIQQRDTTLRIEDYYFRTSIYFEAGDPRYRWLNRMLAIGIWRPIRFADGNPGSFYWVYKVL